MDESGSSTGLIAPDDFDNTSTNLAKPPTAATLTIRVIKSFEFRTEKSLVLHDLNLETTACGELKDKVAQSPIESSALDAADVQIPEVQKESNSRGTIPRRQPTYPPSSAAQQSTPSLVLNDNQPVPHSARVPYQEKVFRMSTQSLPLRRKGKGRVESRPPAPSEYPPPPPLASPLEITRSSSFTNYSQSPTLSEKTYESPMSSPETIPQSPKRSEAPPNVVLDDTYCTPPMTPPDIISPPSIYSQNSPKVQESIRSSIFSRLSNSPTTRGSPASTMTISPPRSEAFSTPVQRAESSRMRNPETQLAAL
ncbi:hypothetical protein FRB99_001911 [Tulasnella sp. 403]|nr:hypothetical protein FRB99_001911 [Tulasnella sp. 403]